MVNGRGGHSGQMSMRTFRDSSADTLIPDCVEEANILHAEKHSELVEVLIYN